MKKLQTLLTIKFFDVDNLYKVLKYSPVLKVLEGNLFVFEKEDFLDVLIAGNNGKELVRHVDFEIIDIVLKSTRENAFEVSFPVFLGYIQGNFERAQKHLNYLCSSDLEKEIEEGELKNVTLCVDIMRKGSASKVEELSNEFYNIGFCVESSFPFEEISYNLILDSDFLDYGFRKSLGMKDLFKVIDEEIDWLSKICPQFVFPERKFHKQE